MFGGRDSGRESNSSSTANGSTSSGRREGTREGRSKTSFFKKLLPGPWKPRSQGWEEQLQSLPDGMREQVLEQVQGQHAKGKKLRILFDDGENIGSEDIMRATYSGPRVRADPTVLHFFKYGELTYKQALVHGFYASFGDFPEVAEKDELPQLSELMERCSVLEGREVILIDSQVDNDLRAFLDGPVVEVASAAGDVLMVRVQRVAVLVATRLGGAMTDGALGAQYSTYSQSLQHTQGSTVLLLGSLSVGTSCHRALLAKLALLRVGITSAIRPTANSRIDGVAPPKQLFWQMEGSVEYVVNLTDRPGELTQVSAHATVPSNAYAALAAAQATPPQSGQAAIPPGIPPQPASVAQAQSHGGTHAHATPPGSPKPSTSSNQPGAQPLQAPAAVYDALATLPVEPARHSSASTHPALSRGGSAASLMTDATGGRGPVIGGVPMPTDLGTQLDATDTSGTAEPAHSSFSGVRGIRSSDSPRAGGSLPLEVFQRGGSMTPPRSLSPTPTTFINRLPNPFAPGMAEAASAATLAASTVSAGSGLSTQVSMSNTGQQGATQQALAETQSMPAQSAAAQIPGGGVTGATAATSAAVVAAALGGPPRIVAWPFGHPEILSVAVRMQSRSGHGGSRRRGAGGNSAGALSTSTVDDTHNHSTLSDRHRERERERERDRERAHNEAVLWMSTESSTGAGGGLNGSFLGGDSGAVNSTAGGTHGASMRHTTHATHASQLASGLGRPTGVGATSHSSHSLSNLPDAGVGGAPGAAQSLQDLSPPSLQHAAAHSSPTLFGDYGAAVGALSGGWEAGGGPVGSASVPALPQSISASGAAPAATSSSGGGSSRRRHRHRLASAFEGSGELRAGAAEAFQNIPQPRVSPSRPPVPPSARSALSANTASPPHGSPILDAPLEAWPSSNAAPRLSELDLRPDTAAGPSAVPSEEMAAWWHGSSRFEVLTQASDPSRYSGSDVLGHGGGRTPGGGDSSIAASSGMDGAGFSGSGLGALASGPPPSGSMSVTPSARHATTKGGAFGDAAGGNGSDTDLDEAASGTVQKFPPIPEAPERWGIGVVSALPTGFGDDDSDGFDGAGSAGGVFSNPTGHGRFDMRDSGGSANLDMSSTVATPAATSTPTRTHSPLSAAGQEATTQHRRRSSGAGGGHGGPVPAAGFASIFRGAFDDDDGGGDTGEADDEPALFAPGGATSGSGSRSPQQPRPGLPHAPRHSSGSYRSAPPATPDDDGTLGSDDSQHSDSSLSRGGVSGVARPYAGRLLSPFGEDEDDGEESEEENVGGAPADDPRSSTDGLGMLQPLPGAFGGGGGVASNLLSPFADNDAGTSGEVSIHSNRIPPVGGGAGSSSLTPPRTPTPARDMGASTGTLNTTGTGTGTTPRRFGSRNGNSFRSETSASNSRGAVAMQPYTALPKGSANPQNPNALPSDSPYDPSSSAADGSTPGTHVDHSVNLDNVPELDFARSSSGRPGFPAVDMSGAISLDHNSTALPSAEANLRALMQNTSIHTLEAQFRMWINTSDITMTETVIGRGSYGQVMLAKFRTERCAVKQIVCETKAEYRAAMQEMLLMQELQFDKIIRFFGAIKRGRGVLWMCMEYMPFSDLRKILHNAEHRRTVRFAESMLSLPRRLKWAKDVVAALDLLHSRAVVHRDLKPGNVLISNKGDAVLSDFGLSRVREAQQSRLQASGPGTVSYAAPEALQANQVSPASDMFSFGCVLWELLSMKEPWAELHGATFQIMSKICHEKASLRVEDIPQDVRETVPNVIAELRKCLSFDPEQRPSAEHVYEVLDDAIESL